MSLFRRIVAECLVTAFLLAAVVDSGIMAEKLASGNMAIALLANTVATGATLTTLIFTFGPISGAHFNPAVTVADASQGRICWRDALAYVAAQVLGAFTGVAVAHLMFGQALLQVSHHIRAGGGQLFTEFVATFGLLCVIWGCSRLRSEAVPVAVGLYITGAILVYGFHFLFQSSGNTRQSVHRHLRRDSSAGCAGFCHYTTPWRFCRDRPFFAGCYHRWPPKQRRLCFHVPILGRDRRPKLLELDHEETSINSLHRKFGSESDG
jgi:hypothetical protein